MNILSESKKRLNYAKAILEEKGIIDTLEKYGNPLLVGSVAMETVWNRDIDIVVETDDIRKSSLGALSEFIEGKVFSKYQYGDFINHPRKNRPRGYIVNLFHRDKEEKLWEIEIWFLEDIDYYRNQLEEWGKASKDIEGIILEKADRGKK